MTKISLITPLRDQHDLFESMMESLIKTSDNPKEIEVLICIDDDDLESIEMRNSWLLRFNFYTNLSIFIVRRSNHFTKDYVNYLASYAKGRFVININADSEFVTPHWDTIIYEDMSLACASSGDDIWLGLVKDGLLRTNEDKFFPNFSCWPVVSWDSIHKLGYFLDERFKIWGPDHFIVQPYRKIHRLVSLTHVKIDHNSVHSGRRKDDGNFARFHKIDHDNPFVITEEIVEESTNQLKRIIHELHHH